MSNKPKYIILLLIWCLFMGVTAISIGVGAMFPALNRIAGPFVCSNGQMRVDSQTYNPYPGTTITTLDWQCVDKQTGKAQPVNEMSMFLINGLIYGFVLFGAILLGYWLMMKRSARRMQQRAAVDVATSHTSSAELSQIPRLQFDNSENAELQELMRMQEEGQLSVAEYWRKLDKIHDRIASQPAAETSSDVPESEELRKLKRLLNEDLITEQDYDQKKAEILSRL